MSNYNLGLTSRINKNRQDFEAGIINYLPLKPMGKLTNWFPGVMREDVTCITGPPASSKTSLVKKWFVHDAIPWSIKKNKNFHVLYFGLEESKRQFLYSLLSYILFEEYGLQYNIKDFEGVGRTVRVEDIPVIELAEKKVETLLPYITYYDHVYNSYGIWVETRKFAESRGQFFLKGQRVSGQNFSMDNSWDDYKANDEEEFILVIVDHLLQLTPQKGEDNDLAKAMWNTVENLRKYAAKKFHYSIVVLQHQNSDLENQESRRMGSVLPTAAGLAVNKMLERLYLNLIGIVNPNKINSSGNIVMPVWDNYNLSQVKDYLRCVNSIKSRYGETNVRDNFFFAGRTGHFDTLPPPNTPEYQTFLNNLKNFK